jgi:hypothetical protein
MTREAWALCHNQSKAAKLTKSEYIEHLIRRGDNSVYEKTIVYLQELHLELANELEASKQQQKRIDKAIQRLRETMVEIGVSPNKLP